VTRLAPFVVFLFLVAGCATPPLRVVPVATIRNGASLEYSYGESNPFRLESLPFDIVALVPRASSDDATAAGQQGDSDAASQTTSLSEHSSVMEQAASATIGRDSSRSTQAARDASSKMHRSDAFSTSQESASSSSVTHSLASERHHSIDSNASQENRSEHATIRQQVASSSGKSLTRSSFLDSSEYVGSEQVEAHHSHSTQRVAFARTETFCANASSTWITTLPTIRKWATQSRVVVGDSFDYVIEVKNNSALDLEFVAIQDSLDDRILVTASDVRSTPRVKLDVELIDQLLSIDICDGLMRGQTVKVIIPAVLKKSLTGSSDP
jgi:hypothetical protein